MTFLAHGAEGGASAHGEFAIFGIALFVVGVMLMVQRSAKPPVALGLAVIGAAIAVGAFTIA